MDIPTQDQEHQAENLKPLDKPRPAQHSISWNRWCNVYNCSMHSANFSNGDQKSFRRHDSIVAALSYPLLEYTWEDT